MKPAAQLQAIAGSRTWDKELVMWVGGEGDLLEALAPRRLVVLDLLDLFNADDLPADDETTAVRLRDQLVKHLQSIQRGPGQRVILVVKSIGLLARYNVGLKAFYDWFIGDFSMTILLLDCGNETTEWPEEVRCESGKILAYFSEPGMVKDVYSTAG